jgi:hypothetical protein
MGGVVAGFSAILPLLYSMHVGSSFCEHTKVGDTHSLHNTSMHFSESPVRSMYGSSELVSVHSTGNSIANQSVSLSLTEPACQEQFLMLNLVVTISFFTADGVMIFYGKPCLCFNKVLLL